MATQPIHLEVASQLMRDICFTPETGRLSFKDVHLASGPVARELQVHMSDWPLLAAAEGSDEAVVEFRTAQGAAFERLMLTLRQSTGPCRWASGMIVSLSHPLHLHDIMMRQARLVDLGGMVSAISHEMKQPLFTIAVAAENIRLLLAKDNIADSAALLKIRADRISEQVDRASGIIDRITRYGRAESLESEPTDVAAALHAARSFLSPILHDRSITVAIEIGPGAHIVDMSRIALEQVLVNAIRNAIEAIELRRESRRGNAGHMRLAVDAIDGRVRCTITDDGTGLMPGVAEMAFEAFYTTKTGDQGTGIGLFISRQIVMETGGDIALLPVEPHGARLEIWLPMRKPADR